MTCSWRRFRISVAVALFLLAMGFGVRYAEDCHQEYFKKAGRNAACHIRKKPEN